MHVAKGFIVREIAGDTVAIPSGEAAGKLSGLIALGGSGKFLFELLATPQTEESLLGAMLDSYEVDADTALADIREFLDTLRQGGVLIED